jgi:DNA-binding Xre family transcriptional regulator
MARFRVKELAEEQGLTITKLHQKALRLSPETTLAYNTVQAIWNNKTKRPDLDTLDAIAKALDVEPGQLIVRDDAGGEPVDEEHLRVPVSLVIAYNH